MDAWQDALLVWYANNRRILPWREEPAAYRVWISEIMLQQTQVRTVIPYFDRFMARFPDVQSLADADQQELLKAWEGLGYYSRARNLQKAARIVAHEMAGRIPGTATELQKLPGIGPYTAAAIASIAFGEAIPVVDGNVLRVFSRFWGIEDDISLPKTRQTIFERLSTHIENVPPSDFNQAIMELGALVCTPKLARCDSCPLAEQCFALREQRVGELPVKAKRKQTPHYDIGVAVIVDGDEVLIEKRPETGMLGGMWEFPGGRLSGKQRIKAQTVALVEEKTGLRVTTGKKLSTVNHAFSHFRITIHPFPARLESEKKALTRKGTYEWVRINELDSYPFPTANKQIVEQLISESCDNEKS